MERGNAKHSPREDDMLAAELSGTLGPGGSNREEWVDPEPPADDDAPARSDLPAIEELPETADGRPRPARPGRGQRLARVLTLLHAPRARSTAVDRARRRLGLDCRLRVRSTGPGGAG